VTVGAPYTTVGYDQTTEDMVIFNRIYQESGFVIAFAGACRFGGDSGRPTYGRVEYNGNNFITNDSDDADWHQNVETTIHEIAHILGMSGFYMYYGRYYNRATSTDYTRNEIIQLNPSDPAQYMVILPDVLNYVQSLFGCNDGTTGAVLQLNAFSDGTPYPGGHWFFDIFYREMMIPSAVIGGNRMTGLSLNLFKASGWYDEVDTTTYADLSVFGAGRGCAFAQNNDRTLPEICEASESSTRCDFEHVRRGLCTTFSDGSIDFATFTACMDETSSLFAPSELEDGVSRCFNSGNSNTAYCFPAFCDPTGNIFFSVDGNLYPCIGASVQVNDTLNIECPTNTAAFCSVTQAPEWCDT